MWRCKGIRSWEVVGERMQLKIDNTVCGLTPEQVPQGVCWPDMSDAGSSAERTQEGTYKREPGPVCSCRACS